MKKEKKSDEGYSKSGKGSLIKAVTIGLLITILIAAVLNYLWPTPWNLQSVACHFKIFIIVTVCAFVNLICVSASGNSKNENSKKISRFLFLLPAIGILVLLIGAISGAQILHSKAYADLIKVETVESSDAIISQDDAESIALMDTASATQLGDREIGSIENFSAFNVSNEYIQLNVENDAVKIAELEYAGLFKWVKNKEAGVTGYVTVSPTTMTANYIELKEGMQYVPSAYFSKDLNRHIHKNFPTLIYSNTHFEVDESGNPYYVSSVYEKTIGLFGGEKVKGAILTEPVSGTCVYYDLDEIPTWVDDVVDGELICKLYNLSFKNRNGYWNGTFLGANTGCMQTTTVSEKSDDDEEDDKVTTDFGYIAKDEDIYIYTGITSMAKDSSNLGFIMVNERTGEYRYFAVSGANEQSAMNAAEGEVQQYSYTASFPTLLNVDTELTYIGVLKDNNGLVKMYYMVNVKDYGEVTVAPKLEECINLYATEMNLQLNDALLEKIDGEVASSDEKDNMKESTDTKAEEVEFTISVIQYIDVDGNTYVYMGTEDGMVYKALFAENEDLLFAKVNDTIRGMVQDGNVIVKSVEPRTDDDGAVMQEQTEVESEE